MDDSLIARLGYDPVRIHAHLIGRPPPQGIAILGTPPEPPGDAAADPVPGPLAGAAAEGAPPAGAADPADLSHRTVPAVPADDEVGRQARAADEASLPEHPPEVTRPPDGGRHRSPANSERYALMSAWLDQHWEVVEAMARADEAPQRPAPPPPSEDPAPAEPRSRPHVARGDRWTKWKMAEFLRPLAATHSVTAAARAVGMSRKSAYKLRARLKGQPFDIAWEAAFRHGFDDLAQAALELALEGEEVPHYHGGKLVGTHRKRNPQLIVALLRMRNQQGAPTLGRYGAAAEFWSEHWEQLTHRIETGSVTWDDERRALTDAELAQLDLPDAGREIDRMIARNCPGGPRKT